MAQHVPPTKNAQPNSKSRTLACYWSFLNVTRDKTSCWNFCPTIRTQKTVAFIAICHKTQQSPCPRGLLVSSSFGTNSLITLRATALFVLIHSGIVNGYQLLCDAHTVLEPHRGTAAFFFIILAIVLFHFFFLLCVCHSWHSFSWVPL